jgi:hypothetical protein
MIIPRATQVFCPLMFIGGASFRKSSLTCHPAENKEYGTKSFTFALFFLIIYVNTFTLRET